MEVVTDARLYIDADVSLDNPLAQSFAQFVSSIVAAGSAWMPDIPLDSAIRCRYASQSGCAGHQELLLREAAAGHRILWQCSDCEDNGSVEHWQESACSLQDISRDDDFYDSDTLMELVLSQQEFSALLQATSTRPHLHAVVAVAQHHAEGALMMSLSTEVERLMEHLASALRAPQTQPQFKSDLKSILKKLHARWLGPAPN